MHDAGVLAMTSNLLSYALLHPTYTATRLHGIYNLGSNALLQLTYCS
jgi:hypothetical protein